MTEASNEPLTIVDQYTDRPALGRSEGDWPYPNEYIRSTANGELAERIRKALSPYCSDSATVWVEECTISGGYSEYTQENDYAVTVNCDGYAQTFDAGYDGVIPALLAWLDKHAPVNEVSA